MAARDAIVGTRISSSGQTTVPSSVRRALHAEIGDTIYWHLNSAGNAIVSALPRVPDTATRFEAPKGATEASPANDEWPSSFWGTLGALRDTTFRLPPELDYDEDAPRALFDFDE